jgi:tetratricopeptide (TPR) repeat protein
VTPNSAQVNIRWEKVVVPFTVEVPNVDALMRSRIDAAVAASPTDWRIPLQVANYYANNSKPDEALRWADNSIKVKETYQNLSTKARMLYASGRKDEAIALAGQAIERGKADKADTAGLEKLLADWKAGKM